MLKRYILFFNTSHNYHHSFPSCAHFIRRNQHSPSAVRNSPSSRLSSRLTSLLVRASEHMLVTSTSPLSEPSVYLYSHLCVATHLDKTTRSPPPELERSRRRLTIRHELRHHHRHQHHPQRHRHLPGSTWRR